LLRPFRFRRDNPFVQQHANQALATILVLLIVFLGGCIYWLGLSYLLVYQRDLYERLPLLGDSSAPVRDVLLFAPLLLVWFLTWLSGLLRALFGSQRTLPIIGHLARRRLLLRLAFAGNTFVLAAAALTTALALHASSLTRDDDEPAAVYLLYDDMGAVPRWVMNLAFYRVSLAAQSRWGSGNVVVGTLDEHHLRLALRHGRFVCLACHGLDGEITTAAGLRIMPPPRAEAGATPVRGLYVASLDAEHRWRPWMLLEAGPQLHLVYNSACDGGSKADEWQQALAPAEVRTFDRLSAVLEHLLWLWSEGPTRVRAMES